MNNNYTNNDYSINSKSEKRNSEDYTKLNQKNYVSLPISPTASPIELNSYVDKIRFVKRRLFCAFLLVLVLNISCILIYHFVNINIKSPKITTQKMNSTQPLTTISTSIATSNLFSYRTFLVWLDSGINGGIFQVELKILIFFRPTSRRFSTHSIK